MKIYIGIKYHTDYRNRDIVETLSDTLNKMGHETSCIIRDFEQGGLITYSPEELMKLTFSEIESCDLAIVDLSEKGVGLGIESGYAFARGIPVVTVASKGSDISGTLKGISRDVLIYSSLEHLKERIHNYLTR